jgi:hypothetical protein
MVGMRSSVKTVKKGGDRLVDMVDLEDKGLGWAVAAVFGFATGVLVAIVIGKKEKEKKETR